MTQTTNEFEALLRLSREDATNFILTWIIATNLDPECRLVLDGNPGPELERALQNFSDLLEKNFPKPNETPLHRYVGTTVPGHVAAGYANIMRMARVIGWEPEQNEGIVGIVHYLRAWPMSARKAFEKRLMKKTERRSTVVH